MRIVKTPGASLLVVEAGPKDAPPILLSNSLGTSNHMWDDVAAILSDRFRVIRYDTRGHGGSLGNDRAFEIADLAGDVVAIINALGLSKVHFAGLSLGGMTGQVLGVEEPARLASLSLLATSAYMPPPSAWTARAATVRAEGAQAILPATLERWFTPGYLKRQTPQARRIAEEFARVDREGYAACCEAIARMDLRASASRIKAHTLIIAGADDPATPVSMAEDLHRSISGSRLIMLKPAAHLLAVEQPEKVAEHLAQHVLRCCEEGATCP